MAVITKVFECSSEGVCVKTERMKRRLNRLYVLIVMVTTKMIWTVSSLLS